MSRVGAALAVLGVLGLTAVGTAAPQADRALSAMDLMLYEEASSLFSEALAADRARPDLRVKQAYAFYRLNRLERAEIALGAELRMRPADPAALILQSFVQYKAGKTADAEKTALAFQTALDELRKKTKPRDFDEIKRDLFPNAGVPAFILGTMAAKKGDAESARARFILARALGYDPAACWIRTVAAEIDGRNLEEALRLCRAGGDLAPAEDRNPPASPAQAKPPLKKPAEIHLLEAFILDQLGRRDESLESLKTASAMKPFDVALAKNLALAWHNRRASDLALPLLRRIVKLDPNDVEARLLLEPLQGGRRILDTAPDLPLSKAFLDLHFDVRYRYVFRAAPDELAARINEYALEMIRHGLIRDAAGWLKAFLENYENSPTIYYNLGQLENSLGFNAAALEYALKAVDLKNDYREAYDLAANVLFKIGEFESAAQYYEESVRRDPQDPVGYYNVGCAYSESGDFEKAERNWLNAVRLEGALPAGLGARDSGNKEGLTVSVDVKVEPISASACQSLGLLYVKQKRSDEDLAFFLKTAELNPRAPLAFLEAGKLYKEKGESGKAGEFFNRYRALGGDEAKVKEILKK